MPNMIVIDVNQCTGCELCVDVCSGSKAGLCSLSESRIRLRRDELSGVFIPVLCMQCSEHPCSEACPEEAIYFDSDLSIFRVDSRMCTGCRACADACPYQAIFLNEDYARKCDLCEGKPACVEVCIPRALTWSQVSEDVFRVLLINQLNILRGEEDA